MKITPELLEGLGFTEGTGFPVPTWVYTAGPLLWVQFGGVTRDAGPIVDGDRTTAAELITALIEAERSERAEDAAEQIRRTN